MIKEALKELQSMAEKELIHEIEGQTYSSVELRPVKLYTPPDLNPDRLETNTLQSIVDYYNSQIASKEFQKEDMFINIKNHGSVYLVLAAVTSARDRITIINANFEDAYKCDWKSLDDFIIYLRSAFIPNKDLNHLLEYLGKIDVQESISTEDDGITQNVVVKKGMSGAIREKKSLPAKVSLKCFRTFPEVDQPEVEYVFRTNKDGDKISCRLFESDGGKWAREAKLNIAKFLREGIKDIPIIA